jgi:hypothetical protein
MKRILAAQTAAALALCGGALADAQSPAAPAAAAALEGDWIGQLDTGALKVRLVLHVHTRDGRTVATFDSPDQNVTGLPAKVAIEAGRVHIAATGAGGAFDSRTTIIGNWAGDSHG